jgi:hypothetical protein
MRQLSAQRKKVVVMAASIAAISGSGPILLRGHHRLELAWLVFMVILIVRLIVLMTRLRRDDGCA